MGIAIELMVGGVVGDTVRALWQRIAALGVDNRMLEGGSRPHVSLSVFDELELGAATQALSSWRGRSVPPVQLSSVGTFATDEGVVFLAPVVTEELLGLHAGIHATFERIGTPWDHYCPGAWVPHLTVATGLQPDAVGPVIDLCRTLTLPMSARFSSIALVEFTPVQVRASVELA